VANITVDDIKLDQSMMKNDPERSSEVDTRNEKVGDQSKKDGDAKSAQVTADTKDLLAQASVATQLDVNVKDNI
jgi:hypothetical protein